MSISAQFSVTYLFSVVEQGKGEALSAHLACHAGRLDETGTYESPRWFTRVVKIAEEERTRTRMTNASWSLGKMDRSTLKSPRCLGTVDWKHYASMARND